MAKDDQQEALEKILASNLTRAIDFIKFAEAKNAALLTFNSAWILALFNVANSNPTLPHRLLVSVSIAITLDLVSVALVIVSFLPRTAISYFFGTNNRSRNLLFVGDIEALLLPDLEASFIERYKPQDGNSVTEKYLKDLSEQIGINSRIAMRKFRSFNRGAALTLLGLGVLSLPYLAQVITFLRAKLSV